MDAIKELLRAEKDGSISFGDPTLDKKSKLEDFKHAGDLLKVKTFREITRLEKNGMVLYESVPGTAVTNFTETENGVSFTAEGDQDAQVTLGLAEDTTYRITVSGEDTGAMKTNLGGKLSISLPLEGAGPVEVVVQK